MNTLTLFLTIPCLLVVTKCCMRMVPPDDVYIPSTLAPEQSTVAPEESTMAPVEISTTMVVEETTKETMTTPAMESSTVTEKECPVSAAKCPDLATIVVAIEQTTDSDGCIEFSCGTFPTYFRSSFGQTEVPPQSAGDGPATRFVIYGPLTPDQAPAGLVVYFGLTCENNQLIATKYPRGIVSFSNNMVYGSDGSFVGKSILNRVDCD